MGTSVPVILFAVLLAGAPAGAQEWKQAYETGDVFRALDILQPLVFEAAGNPRFEHDLDPMAPLYLATYYVNGWRVEKDPVIACGLAMLARNTANMQGRFPEPMKFALEAVEEKTCALLSAEQRLDALMAGGGCPNLGLAGQTVHLEGGGWVEITQRKFIVDQGGRRTEVEISMPCAQHVLPLRYRKLVPPPGSPGHARDLVQMFAWYSGVSKGERSRGLMCTIWEVVDGTILRSAVETVADEPGSAWPLRPVPDLVQFEFKYAPSGEVEYNVVNAAGQRTKGDLRPYDDLVKEARRSPR
jgi:hypothetical protein